MNENKIILDLCGGTGSWSKPYKDAGYDVMVITLPEFDVIKTNVVGENIYFFGSSQVMCIPTKIVYGILAAPPCTMFSLARNDKTAKSPRDLKSGMKTVDACLRIIHACLYANVRANEGLKFWALENPATGYLKRFLGKPALVFQPFEYGDPYTKQTALWGCFKEPVKKTVEPIDIGYTTPKGKKRNDFTSLVERYADTKDIPDGYIENTGYDKRQVLRSMTPLGFAKAFYKANR